MFLEGKYCSLNCIFFNMWQNVGLSQCWFEIKKNTAKKFLSEKKWTNFICEEGKGVLKQLRKKWIEN